MRVHPGVALAALFVGLVVGGVGMAAWSQSQPAVIEVVEGEAFATADYDGLAMEGNRSYALTPDWQEAGTWQESWPPSCVPGPDEDPIPMQIGVVEVAPTEESFGREVVAWIRCGVGGD